MRVLSEVFTMLLQVLGFKFSGCVDRWGPLSMAGALGEPSVRTRRYRIKRVVFAQFADSEFERAALKAAVDADRAGRERRARVELLSRRREERWMREEGGRYKAEVLRGGCLLCRRAGGWDIRCVLCVSVCRPVPVRGRRGCVCYFGCGASTVSLSVYCSVCGPCECEQVRHGCACHPCCTNPGVHRRSDAVAGFRSC